MLKHICSIFFKGDVVIVRKQVSAWEETPCTLPHFTWGKRELNIVSSDPEISQDHSGGTKSSGELSLLPMAVGEDSMTHNSTTLLSGEVAVAEDIYIGPSVAWESSWEVLSPGGELWQMVRALEDWGDPGRAWEELSVWSTLTSVVGLLSSVVDVELNTQIQGHQLLWHDL